MVETASERGIGPTVGIATGPTLATAREREPGAGSPEPARNAGQGDCIPQQAGADDHGRILGVVLPPAPCLLALAVSAWPGAVAWAGGAAEPSPRSSEEPGGSALGVTDGEPPAEDTPEPGDDRLRVHTDRVEAEAVVRSLELRVGPRWRRWSIDVDEAAGDSVGVRLRDDAGTTHTRELLLTAETPEGRSRELASALALLVDQLEATSPADPDPDPDPEDPPPPEPRGPSGWIGAGPRVALGLRTPVHLDAGASLAGGTWLLREHLQPVVEVAWARTRSDDLVVDAVRAGGGVLGGAAALEGRLWWGGGGLLRAQWAQARSGGRARGWWLAPAVVGAIQGRVGPLTLGLWVGVDLLVPPLVAEGDAATIRWDFVRPMAALHVGPRLAPQKRRQRGG